MLLCISIRGFVCPSVHPSIGLFVGPYMLFSNDEGEKSSNDIIIKETSDDEVLASYVPPRYLFVKIQPGNPISQRFNSYVTVRPTDGPMDA